MAIEKSVFFIGFWFCNIFLILFNKNFKIEIEKKIFKIKILIVFVVAGHQTRQFRSSLEVGWIHS